MGRRLSELLALGWYEELARVAAREFDLAEVDPKRLRDACMFGGQGWTADARMWLKHQMEKAGLFPRCDITDETNERMEVRLYVKLHCFPINIDETPDHLARLHNEHLGYNERKAEEREGSRDTTARSRVFTTPQVVHPVDRVAIRVAPAVVPPDPEELKKLSVEQPRRVAAVKQVVLSSSGEPGEVTRIRKCPEKGCPGVVLVTRWPDGEVTRPCTAGMRFNGVDTWRIPEEAE